jgi:hypothetical protein
MELVVPKVLLSTAGFTTSVLLDGRGEHDARDCADEIGRPGGDPNALQLAGGSKPRDFDRRKPHG